MVAVVVDVAVRVHAVHIGAARAALSIRGHELLVVKPKVHQRDAIHDSDDDARLLERRCVRDPRVVLEGALGADCAGALQQEPECACHSVCR